MRHLVLMLALLAVAAPGVAAVDRTPTLRIVNRAPLVVAGTHFRAVERVTVKAADVTRVVRTTRLGAFRAELGTIATERCSLRVVALGARGDYAALALRAMCAPASTA